MKGEIDSALAMVAVVLFALLIFALAFILAPKMSGFLKEIFGGAITNG